MSNPRREWWPILAALAALLQNATAQLDPVERHSIQLGYNQSLKGVPPFTGYGFYYYNKPGFYETNLTLRAILSPVYIDSELGIRNLLSPHTDLAVGLNGGGFADSYYEFRQGRYLREESFMGHAVEGYLAAYHLFNPDALIPLYGIARVGARESFFDRESRTSPDFQVPDNLTTLNWRAGLRWGGAEPLLQPAEDLELSLWYDGQRRDDAQRYGFGGDREIEPVTHRFFGRAMFAYTFPTYQYLSVSLSGGMSVHADRLSAFRLGSALPFSTEFPLSLPGYFYQELSARHFGLGSVTLCWPIGHSQRWNVFGSVASAYVDYLPGLEQSGNWNTGVSGGISYYPPSKAWQVMAGYGYGFNAIRGDHRGGQSIGILVQFSFDEAKKTLRLTPSNTSEPRGLGEALRPLF